jgi:DNA-binding phage protein
MSPIMTKPFDPAIYLDTDEAVATYLTEALETRDQDFVADARVITARARQNIEAAGKL